MIRGIVTNFYHFRPNFYSTKTLNSAQIAFANRIGFDQISASKLLVALSHPKFPPNKDQESQINSEFNNLIKIGNDSLHYFTREYLKARFPSLTDKFLQVGMKMFLAEKNLLQFAMFLGIDSACGIDSHLREKWIRSNQSNTKKKHKKKLLVDESENLNETEIRLDCFKALLGLIGTETGPLNLRKFLDSRYFNNSLFNPKDLVRPLYPIPDLTEIYPNLVFRLHQESGRLSNNSMFIVGVYADKFSQECLGEGFGASQALAQHRAATEALRKLFLIEKRVIQRPSDSINTTMELLKGSNL